MLENNQTWWQWLDHWMSQSAADWHPLSWAMDNNPILIGVHLVAGTILAVTFLTLAGGFIYQSYKGGFMNKDHRLIVIFFTTFIALCGAIFVAREVVMFIPIYWVYGGIKIVTAIFALLTLITYVRIFPELKKYPSAREFLRLQEENEELKRSSAILVEHIDAWNDDVGHHISVLKNQQKALVEDLESKGMPVTKVEDIHKTSEPLTKSEALASLERIKKDLDDLMGNINERESK